MVEVGVVERMVEWGGLDGGVGVERMVEWGG